MFTERQKEILGKAAGLMASKGLQNLTIRNLAGEMSVTEAALYRHFRSKQDIIKGVVRLYDESSSGILKEVAIKKTSGQARIKKFFMSRIELFRRSPDMAYVMFSNEIFMGDEEIASDIKTMMEKHKNILITIIRDGRKEGCFRKDVGEKELFRIIFGSFRLLMSQWVLTKQGFDLEDEGGKLISSILLLLRPKL